MSSNNATKIVQEHVKKYSGEGKSVDVISAVQLTEEQLHRVKNVLAEKLGEVVEVTNLLDESLIGGLVFKFNGHVSDMSLKNQLKNLKLQIMGKANSND
ncbi:MAG: F0F1 ATP synthase subunit delta [Oscillospiraceae bacterium]|nr:F0F1 ATP synthase subunit delta [Oscillospiraceae bacterium]